jgi:pimeloyl-ACP methyl ester carboxylesterase
LVLISPHDRLISVINARWPWIPAWWLKDRFDSQTHMERVRCPCLLVVGDRDTTIPAETSRALFSGWDGALSEFVAQGSGHRGLLKRGDVHRALAEFL